jgi:hypothetical protein
VATGALQKPVAVAGEQNLAAIGGPTGCPVLAAERHAEHSFLAVANNGDIDPLVCRRFCHKARKVAYVRYVFAVHPDDDVANLNASGFRGAGIVDVRDQHASRRFQFLARGNILGHQLEAHAKPAVGGRWRNRQTAGAAGKWRLRSIGLVIEWNGNSASFASTHRSGIEHEESNAVAAWPKSLAISRFECGKKPDARRRQCVSWDGGECLAAFIPGFQCFDIIELYAGGGLIEILMGMDDGNQNVLFQYSDKLRAGPRRWRRPPSNSNEIAVPPKVCDRGVIGGNLVGVGFQGRDDAEEENPTHESIAPSRIILCRLPIDIVDLSRHELPGTH